MSYCFAFLSNDAGLLVPALGPFRAALELKDGAPHGWGLGYYQAGQPLVRKQPKAPDGPLDFADKLRNLRTNLVMGHRWGRSVGAQSTENMHPFRFRNWMFAHVGEIQAFPALKADLLASVPDFMKRNIRGSTDSEHLFHLFLAFLNDTGRMDDPDVTGGVAARALSSTLTYLDRLVRDHGGQQDSFCCMATNGRIVVATHRGMPLNVARHNSYHNVGRTADDRPLSYPHLRAVILVAGIEPPSPGWETVAQGALVTIDANLNIEYQAVDR